MDFFRLLLLLLFFSVLHPVLVFLAHFRLTDMFELGFSGSFTSLPERLTPPSLSFSLSVSLSCDWMLNRISGLWMDTIRIGCPLLMLAPSGWSL